MAGVTKPPKNCLIGLIGV